MPRPPLVLAALALWAPVAWAQPRARAPDGGAGADDRVRLTDAVADGALELLGANLDRYADMVTRDLRDRAPEAPPADDEQVVMRPGDASAVPWETCDLDGPVMPVDLRTGTLIPMQVTVAGRGHRAVALVTLGRPPGGRHGMAFPESRWVEWDAGEPDVSNAIGFGVDPALVLREHGGAVVSVLPAADDPTPDDGPFGLAFTRVGDRGRALGNPYRVPGTEGMDLDAPPVDWAGGTALILGHDGEPPERHRAETLWFLDASGRPVRGAVTLTAESADIGFGAPCAALAAGPHGSSLIAAWTVADGPRAGVWVRRGITLAARDLRGGARDRSVTERWVQGGGWWGPVVGADGLLVRRSARSRGDLGGMAEVLLSRGRSGAPALMGAWWDPLAVWSSGGAFVVGTEPGSGDDAPPRPWAGAVRPGARVADAIALAGQGFAGLREPVDVAVAALERGAVVAWIEERDEGRRQLALARLGCRPRR